MPLTGNAINISHMSAALSALAERAGPEVTAAIRKASLETGVNFAYLMRKANTESSFKPAAHAKGSSASGLYQFISSTWLQVIKRYGDKYGLDQYAAQIDKNGHVSSPQMKKQILALRDDPQISALMAGELSQENRQSMINLGISQKDIGGTELYLAHFLGAGSAAEYIKAMKSNPLTPAADLFPAAAKANPHLFYTKTARARTLGEIYAIFDKKFTPATPPQTTNPTALAANTGNNSTSGMDYHYASNSILRTIPQTIMASDGTNNAARAAMMQLMMGDDNGDASLFADLYKSPAASPTLPGASVFNDPAVLATLASTRTAQQSTHNNVAATHHQGIKAYLLHTLMETI